MATQENNRLEQIYSQLHGAPLAQDARMNTINSELQGGESVDPSLEQHFPDSI